jgi:hypothetical protein
MTATPWRAEHWSVSPHNFDPAIQVPPHRVELHDITIRDGEECADVAFTVDDKVKIVEALAAVGMRRTELFLTVPGWLEAVRAILSTDRDEARGTSPGPGPGAASEGPGSYNHVRFFFELLHRLPNPDDVEEGNRVIEALHGEGYSDADIDYTVKWTVRHIPGVQRFGMVQVCIKEALQEKWSI